MSSSVKVKVPRFDSVKKPYKRYKEDVETWCIISGVPVKEQALFLAYELPEDDPSDIKNKVFLELGRSELHDDNGVKNYLQYMDGLFEIDDLSEHYDDYVKFETFKRDKSVSVANFVNEFETLHNIVKKRDMDYSKIILGFKLLDAACISAADRKFVLSGVNFKEKATFYEQVKSSLRKYISSGCAYSGEGSSTSFQQDQPAIKVEPVLHTSSTPDMSALEDTLAAHGFFRKKENKFNYSARGGKGNGRGQGRSSSSNYRGFSSKKVVKRINPIGDDGERILCPSCGSYRHLLEDCPDSYENMRKSQGKHDDLALIADNARSLVVEASNKGVLDSACTATVTGSDWLAGYIDLLPDEQKSKVVCRPGTKWFKFGGGEMLKSLKQVELPVFVGGRHIRLLVEVVDSYIPLLISSATLQKLDGIIDVGQSRVSIFGKWYDCDKTTSGLLMIDLGNFADKPFPVEKVLVALDEGLGEFNSEQAIQYLTKIHRQFGHPSKQRLCNLLKDANKWKDEYLPLINKLHDGCEACKLHAKTLPRPIVALPAACEFSEVLTMDLKECNYNSYHYILHMIDAFTRYSVSVFLRRKEATLVVQAVMSKWIAIFERPKRIWTDMGTEFSNDEMKEMSEALGTELGTGGAYAPWMNGLCERNHMTIDLCLEKILHQYPAMDIHVALVWANNARNTMRNCNGFSPHQLVFGRNPNLPSIETDKLPSLSGVTTSKTVGDHLNALHAARKAFVESETSERIRRALRHNVRTSVETTFKSGDKVYYRKHLIKKSPKWHGPATVLGCDGLAAFINHQGSVYSVPTCRLQHVGEEFLKELSTAPVQQVGNNKIKLTTKLKSSDQQNAD